MTRNKIRICALLNIVVEVLAHSIRKDKEIKGIQIRKEERKKKSLKNFLEQINEFFKFTEYKTNTKISVTY